MQLILKKKRNQNFSGRPIRTAKKGDTRGTGFQHARADSPQQAGRPKLVANRIFVR